MLVERRLPGRTRAEDVLVDLAGSSGHVGIQGAPEVNLGGGTGPARGVARLEVSATGLGLVGVGPDTRPARRRHARDLLRRGLGRARGSRRRYAGLTGVVGGAEA